jgi:hypothetical protein
LAWGKGGNVFVRKRVKHPGIKANPYFAKALESPEIDKVISNYGDDVVKNLSLDIEKSWGKK